MSIKEAIASRKYSASSVEFPSTERPPLISELMKHRRMPLTPGWLLDFGIPPDIDIYNSSAPIWDGHHWLQIVREEKGDQFTSQLTFFSQVSGNKYRREVDVSNLSELSIGYICQDPANAWIQQNLVITQVEVDPQSLNDTSQDTRLHSAIYAGENLNNLRLIARSPDRMKGVRLVELQDGKIAVFTRPQSPGDPDRGGLGKIGLTVVESLDQINTDVLAAAPLIPELFSEDDEEWRGVNHVRLLPNGDLAVLAHIARFEKSEIDHSKGYYPYFFTLDPITLRVENQQLLAKVADFRLNGQIKAKLPELENVSYPSALLFPNDDITSSYAIYMSGMKDSKMAAICIPNPLDSWLETHHKYAVQPFAQSRWQKVITDSLAA